MVELDIFDESSGTNGLLLCSLSCGIRSIDVLRATSVGLYYFTHGMTPRLMLNQGENCPGKRGNFTGRREATRRVA